MVIWVLINIDLLPLILGKQKYVKKPIYNLETFQVPTLICTQSYCVIRRKSGVVFVQFMEVTLRFLVLRIFGKNKEGQGSVYVADKLMNKKRFVSLF